MGGEWDTRVETRLRSDQVRETDSANVHMERRRSKSIRVQFARGDGTLVKLVLRVDLDGKGGGNEGTQIACSSD